MSREEIYRNYGDFFEGIKKDQGYSRLGKTFETTKNFYFYDTGTGKVMSTSASVNKVLKILFETNEIDSIFELGLTDEELKHALREMKEAFLDENILQAPPVLNMVGPQTHSLKETINDELQQITLEITERCNFRCNYCIFTDEYESFRNFGKKDMSLETAEKAIDDLKQRSKNQDEVNIGFYGGEPLLRFSFIKECISYAQKVMADKKLAFAITSNMSLMTPEIANFFATQENVCTLLASIDGPKWIHDRNRRYSNGKGTFDDTIIGIKNAFEAFGAVNKTEQILFSVVVSADDYNQVLFDISNFIRETSWIPDNIQIELSNVSVHRSPTEYTGLNSQEEIDYFSNEIADPFLKFAKEESDKGVLRHNRLTSTYEEKAFYMIHNRPLYDKPMRHYPMNGCCVPFARRTYVSTEGDYYICEKVGDVPKVGSVYEGLDIQKVKKLYVDDYINEAIKYCGECWAINLCTECYINSFDSDGVNWGCRHIPCRTNRYLIYQDLKMYHEILESSPEKLEYLNEVVID